LNKYHHFHAAPLFDVNLERNMHTTKTLLATLAIGIAFAGPAFAEKMKATLDAKSENPPNSSAGKGTADLDYDAATKKLTWKLTYSGLSGPPTAAHFHGPADPSKNAAVAVAIPNPSSSPVEGSATLTDAQAADLMAGQYYINVHTAANPGGEIRGQVMK
jgi:hypothetical protein